MKLVFATNNQHKLDEVRKITAGYAEIISLSDIDCHDDIPETADTLEGNALLKARYIKEKFGYDCFADDTGLEVEVLNNAPGVYSARYAGTGHDSEANMNKLLSEMNHKENRKARFRTSSLQGVSTNICTSFMVRATRGFSIELIPFTFALMSTVRYSSMNACFSPALTIEK